MSERHAPGLRIGVVTELTPPNEEHEVEVDAFVHVIPNNTLHHCRVGARNQDIGSSVSLKSPRSYNNTDR